MPQRVAVSPPARHREVTLIKTLHRFRRALGCALRRDADSGRIMTPRLARKQHHQQVEGLVVAGLTELALGALTGWPMAIAVSRPEDLPKIGIRSRARLRQWHLDLIMLGSLTAAASRFVPNPPRTVAVPLAVGAWVNANAFGVLAFRPDLVDHPVYKTGVAASFVSATWGFTGLATVAWRRWLTQR